MATTTERTTAANGTRITSRHLTGETAMARRAAAALPRADRRVARVSDRGGHVTVWLDTPDDEPFSFERPDGWTAPEHRSPMIVTTNGNTGVRMVPECDDR